MKISLWNRTSMVLQWHTRKEVLVTNGEISEVYVVVKYILRVEVLPNNLLMFSWE